MHSLKRIKFAQFNLNEVIIMKTRTSMFMLAFALAATLPVLTVAPAYAQTTAASASLQDQAFFKKKYRIKGTWSLVERDGKNLSLIHI